MCCTLLLSRACSVNLPCPQLWNIIWCPARIQGRRRQTAAAEAENSGESRESHQLQSPEPHHILRDTRLPTGIFMVWLLLLLTFESWTKGWFQKARGLGGHSGPMLWLYQVFYDLVSTYLNPTLPAPYTRHLHFGLLVKYPFILHDSV